MSPWQRDERIFFAFQIPRRNSFPRGVIVGF
jgi:hypothetical protein